MDSRSTYRIKDFCGEPPFHFAKTEALLLLGAIDARAEGIEKELAFDFTDVLGVSPSGASVFIAGLIRRCRMDVFSQVIFLNANSEIVLALEDAVGNTDGREAQKTNH